ncbi:MAG: ATP-dependent zinc metalloprotease FtsH [Clostridia bacterium]|nr:ATP-dependent zinc metalloprotease FtsH [Clostridia bacterium]
MFSGISGYARREDILEKNKRSFFSYLPYILIPVILVASMMMFSSQNSEKAKKEYYEIVRMFEENDVEEYMLNLSSGVLQYDIKSDGEDKTFKYNVPNVSLFIDDVHDIAKENGVKYNYNAGRTNSWLTSMLPTVLMMLVLGALMLFMIRKMNQSISSENNKTLSFGKARVKVKDDKHKTTFDDVAGADEEKEELAELVEFLRNPKRFSDLGARIPKGVLLVGPPGTGKTLLAKAVAGEADVPFFSISGSDFVEMYVGVGASRVRDLFQQAKKESPSIIFIDEIDAVGRHRGAGMGGGHDEREQTLNQMLVEMDGFGINDGVIVIAATNRPDILDPALLRPGRFDRQVTVGYPDIKGREEILQVHAKGKPLAPDVELKKIAQQTVGFTGADLENLLNEAALLAARKGIRAITMTEIEEASIKVIVGTEKRSHKVNEKDKKLTAYHEAGHAVATYYLETQDPVRQVSIVPRGMAGGFTMSVPTEDKLYKSRNSMLEDIVVLLGGRVAEAITFGDISTGASNDIERASDIARKMVTKYGMSDELGPIAFGTGHDEVFLGRDYSNVRNYSETVAAKIDSVVGGIIMDAYNRCTELLKDHSDKLEIVAEYLIKHEKIGEKDFADLMEDKLMVDNATENVVTEIEENSDSSDE